MITIEDSDSPVLVAGKIIHGTKPFESSPLQKAFAAVAFGDETACDTQDMFDLEEIKEISDYLMVYYLAHEKKGD